MNIAQRMRERAITIILIMRPVLERRSELWFELSSLVCLSMILENIFCLVRREMMMGLRVFVT